MMGDGGRFSAGQSSCQPGLEFPWELHHNTSKNLKKRGEL